MVITFFVSDERSGLNLHASVLFHTVVVMCVLLDDLSEDCFMVKLVLQ